MSLAAMLEQAVARDRPGDLATAEQLYLRLLGLKRVPDWRWFLARDDGPWYPGMRRARLEEML